MTETKPCYTIDNFPFDDLRVGANDEKGYIANKFGSGHQMTYVEVEPGIYKEYEIERPPMKSTSFSYWYEENNSNRPGFYQHLILHPRWSDKDAKSGEVSKTLDETGVKVATFLEKYKSAIERELKKMSDEDREVIMGYERAHENKWIEPIAQHPKYEKGHKRANTPNLDKSQTWPTGLWTQDMSRKNNNNNNNNSDNKGDKGKKKGDGGIIKVPKTDVVIFTKYYDDTGDLDKPVKVTDYEGIKKDVYKPDSHPNASPVICDMLSSGKFLCPSILWNPKTGAVGKIQFKISEHVTMIRNPRSYSNEMSEDRANEVKNAKAKAMAAFGMSQEPPKEEVNEKKRPASSAIDALLNNNNEHPNKKREFRSTGGDSPINNGSGDEDEDPDLQDLIRETREIGEECFNQQ